MDKTPELEPSYLGYNFTCAIQGNFIPQRLQNLCIRDYAQSKKLFLSFSVSEYSDTRQALMLFAQFENLDRIQGFIFYSLMLLPADRALRQEFCRRVTDAGKPVYFALEDLALTSAAQVPFIERLFLIGQDSRLEENRMKVLDLYGKGLRAE